MKENLGLALYAFLFMVLPFLFAMSCSSSAEQRQHWQDCSAVYHEECWNRPPSLARDCEYEYYKECVNG
jgi:uncharacterized BrkB/YihY/UPF0761 family membrane protein